MKYKFIMILFIGILTPISLLGQTNSLLISGRVVDNKNEALIGASITETDNPRNSVITDVAGNFKLKLTGKSITVSYISYITRKVNLGNQTNLVITMLEDTKGLDEVMVVGYGTQKKITNTGAVSSLNTDVIKSIPTSSIQNTLAGRLPGFFSQQRSGQPGANATDFYIRGSNSLNSDTKPLIIVDDIEYTYDQVQQLNVNEIVNVTILKDASTTAIYGVRGANGVLVITTRRGRSGKPRINVTAETGIQRLIIMPTYLDSYAAALLRNEAVVNDNYGKSTPANLEFSDADLALFKSGADPYGHPNVDWSKQILNRNSIESKQNIDISGGNELVKYFVSFGHLSQNGMVKNYSPTDGLSDVNPNYFYRRTNFRSNLDITPTKTLKLRFDLNGQFEVVNKPKAGDLNGSNGNVMNLVNRYASTAPYATPLINPNGSFGYSTHRDGDQMVNLVSAIANGGYNRNYNNNLKVVIGAEQKLDFITNGLGVKAIYSYASNVNDYRNLTRDIGALPAYKYNPVTDKYSIKNSNNTRYLPYGLSAGNSAFNNMTIIQAILTYDRTFDSHHVYGLTMFNRRSYVDKEKLAQNYIGTTLRLGYDFERKYLFEFNVARNGNDMFQKSQRYGVFPAVSIGWNLAEEKFFKKALPLFDLFKLRGSYGLVGSDNGVSAPVLNQTYSNTNEAYNFGSSYTAYNAEYEGALVNPYVTWEKEKKTDIGLDINMFAGKLVVTADYFYNYRYDQLISQNAISLLIGQSVPKRNVGETENKGFDGIITWRDKIGDLNYSVGFTASHAKNKIIYTSEAPDYPYQAITGRQIGVGMGYHCVGFYQQDDFNADGTIKASVAHPTWSILQPGDLKYADMNNDGLVNEADKTYYNKPNMPTTTYGLSLSASFKGFSVSVLFQGAFDYSMYIGGEAAEPFSSNLRPFMLNRWTPSTASTATYPRLGVTPINNRAWGTTPSDFWQHDASYVRLKSLELGYELPEKILANFFIKSVRFYTTGYNLITWNKLDKYQQDAEIGDAWGKVYPNTANINFGVQIGF